MAKKNALGRGLGALIEEAEPVEVVAREAVATGTEIHIDLVDTNPFQPRTVFDSEALEELSSSIKEIGVIQPITVRQMETGRFQLITGERRFRAARIAGLTHIPAYIRTANDQGMLEMALVENIQREDLNAVDIAISYQRLLEECELTQENLSVRVGKKRATVANYLRLLKLPAEIQVGVRDNKISMGHARALAGIDDPHDQLKLFYKIIEEELSVRKTEELARKLESDLLKHPEPEETKPQKSPASAYDELKNQLSGFFNTKVSFQHNNNGSGKIVIPFRSDDELERIIGIFDRLKD
ncbi:MAG: ParB/RepB/Spo0J family partition protein [Bacteroidales bacterium]|nr:ParB/RepB/Spo0J family partition protein [Bacteroidales bacterium]